MPADVYKSPVPTRPVNGAEIRPEDGDQTDQVFPLEEHDEGTWH